MTLDDLELDCRRCFQILSITPVVYKDKDLMFGSRMGFSGTTDLMV